MKAQELRIGNLTFNENYDLNTISHEDFLGVNKDGTLPLWPIPLTEEWLVKFGFQLSIGIYEAPRSDYWIEKEENEEHTFWLYDVDFNSDTGGHIMTSVQYVHQLQNLYFALTGEELNLTK